MKISFRKVKGATGYRVLIYKDLKPSYLQTPLLYAKTTKKTTYTIQNLVPAVGYVIKVQCTSQQKLDTNFKFFYS